MELLTPVMMNDRFSVLYSKVRNVLCYTGLAKAYRIEVFYGRICLCGLTSALTSLCSRYLSPSVLGNVFSKSRAMSGSFNRAFISEMTFCDFD